MGRSALPTISLDTLPGVGHGALPAALSGVGRRTNLGLAWAGCPSGLVDAQTYLQACVGTQMVFEGTQGVLDGYSRGLKGYTRVLERYSRVLERYSRST